jgi:heme exporter protein A
LTPLLQADSLCLLRGDRCLFKDLEFALRQGEMLVVEGPNGSGKTSLLRGIAGLLEFEEGAVSWAGRPVRESFHEFRANLAWFSHRVGFKGDLTLLENLTFEAGLRAMDTQRLDAVLAQLGLAKLVSLPFRALSAGQQRRVALARMLLSAGKLWMMDEPFTNLDRDGQTLVVQLIERHLADGGLSIVASHQHLDIDGSTRRIELR